MRKRLVKISAVVLSFSIILGNGLNFKADDYEMADVGNPFIEIFADMQLATLVSEKVHKKPTDILTKKDVELINSLLIKNNGITDLRGISVLSSLQELIIEDVPLKVLPSEIGKLTDLYSLYVNRTEIEKVPEEIGELKELRRITFDHNKLSETDSIPESLYTLPKVDYLSFQGNKLTVVSRAIGNMTTLRMLRLENNELTSLPETIGNIKALVDITVYNNQLTTLPSSISNLQNLRGLYAYDNQLTVLPSNMINLVNLQQVHLFNNKLSALPEDFAMTDHIKSISLSNNELVTLPKNIGELDSVTTLDLSNNKIESLPPEIGGLEVLETLTLSQNKLSTLPDEIGNLKKVHTLDLKNNQLTSLPKTLGLMTNLTRSLELEGNLLDDNYINELNQMNVMGGNLAYTPQSQVMFNPIKTRGASGHVINASYTKDIDSVALSKYISVNGVAIGSAFVNSLESIKDVSGNTVQLSDYLVGGEIVKEGVVTAQVRATNPVGTHVRSNRSLTPDTIEIVFTKPLGPLTTNNDTIKEDNIVQLSRDGSSISIKTGLPDTGQTTSSWATLLLGLACLCWIGAIIKKESSTNN